MKTENLQEWVGKTEERNDLLTSFPAKRNGRYFKP
jgi:hypothetical protein